MPKQNEVVGTINSVLRIPSYTGVLLVHNRCFNLCAPVPRRLSFLSQMLFFFHYDVRTPLRAYKGGHFQTSTGQSSK